MGFSAAFSSAFAHDPAPTPAPTQPTDEGPAPPAAPAGVPRLCDSNLLLTGIRVLTAAHKPGAVALYAALVIRCGDKGVCWPNQETLCADVGVSEATIKRRVADLVAAGLVMVQRRRNKSQLYRLTRLAGWEPISLVDKPVDDAADDTRPDIRNGQQADRRVKVRRHKRRAAAPRMAPLRIPPTARPGGCLLGARGGYPSTLVYPVCPREVPGEVPREVPQRRAGA